MSGGAREAPLLLGLDTATGVASWALWSGDGPIGERAAEPGRAAAEVLLPTLDALLAGTGVSLLEVDAFAVSIGPGSFTGLRVGVATVKGLAFEPERPALAVPTLRAVAAHAGADARAVAAVLDARRGEVYAAGFEAGADGSLHPASWLPEGVVPAAELASRIPPGCRVVGEGVAVCAQALAACDAAILAPPYPETTARHVAALGARRFAEGAARDAGELVPRYVRRAEAEVKRTGARFESP